MYLHGASKINAKGNLEIGGVDTVCLAKEFGTPLYVYDVAHIKKMAKLYQQSFISNNTYGKIAYASKAFSCVAMIQLIDELNLYLDVVSGGELYTALLAGFPPEKIHFHGSNKSRDEIGMAVKVGIGCFVVDNFTEIQLLRDAAHLYNKKLTILLRVTPGVLAYTHKYISTGGEDSKFGFDLNNGSALAALREVLKEEQFHVLGFHCHIGSQIFDSSEFVQAIQKLFSLCDQSYDKCQFYPKVLNVGGGFGIRYTDSDIPKSPSEYIDEICRTVAGEVQKREMPMPEIWIEPGRSLVGNAGTILYSIGSSKDIEGCRRYIAVDGGMNDNLRPALYSAKYEGAIANKMNQQPIDQFTVAGKCCESGDMLIWDLSLPEINYGDILAVFSTGAYGYSMANNYNRFTRPAVVFVEDGEAELVVRRETYEDVVRYDLSRVSSK